jgi:DNA repair exonuclease SbcCD ATPase subunit
MAGQVGRENLLGGFVHRDEVRTGDRAGEPVRDHMHVPFTPILDGRFAFKRMCPRDFYRSLHGDLGDYLEKRMGYRPSIELTAQERGERVYAERTADIDRVRAAVDAQTADARKERDAASFSAAQARMAAVDAKAEVARERKRASRASERATDAEKAAQAAEKALAAAEAAKKASEASRDAISAEVAQTKADLATVKAERDAAAADLAAVRAGLDAVRAARDKAQKEEAEACRKKDEAEAARDKAQKDVEDLKSQKRGLEADLEKVRGDLAGARADLAAVRRRTAEMLTRAKDKFFAWVDQLVYEPTIDEVDHAATRAWDESSHEEK